MGRKGFWRWRVVGAQRGSCRSVVEGRWRRFCEGEVFEHFVFFVLSQPSVRCLKEDAEGFFFFCIWSVLRCCLFLDSFLFAVDRWSGR